MIETTCLLAAPKPMILAQRQKLRQTLIHSEKRNRLDESSRLNTNKNYGSNTNRKALDEIYTNNSSIEWSDFQDFLMR